MNFLSDCPLGRQRPSGRYTKRKPVLSLPGGFREMQVTSEGGWMRKMGESINCSVPKVSGRRAARVGITGPRVGTQAQPLDEARPSQARRHQSPLPTQQGLCKVDTLGYFFLPPEQTEKAGAPQWKLASG